MDSPDFTLTTCLEHQRLEDQMSRVGLVCPECKRRLYLDPPHGRCMSFWESQPAAYTLDGQPCFVFSLMWDDYRIRSLHPADSENDQRGAIVRDAHRHHSERDWDWRR